MLKVEVNDNYETPDSAYELLKGVGIIKGNVVYDPFFCAGRAKSKMERILGCVAINHNEDFWDKKKRPKKYDIIITNPPFSVMKKVIHEIIRLGKPYAILMRATHVESKYFRELMKKEKYSIIWPKSRMKFEVDGKSAGSPPFDSVWVTNMKSKRHPKALCMEKI